ncbi:hypothetical protein [Rhodopseudomonas telluris]|uniref:Uncharacterized protein n=1 Tax=Rhodopseudomonas telluris TaxID=644215 RepID=A0ABV6EMH3_9BRAD
MTLFLAIRRLLAAVMVAGLVLAPLARPATAGTPSAVTIAMHGTSAHATSAEDVAMSGMADHAMAGHQDATATMDEMSASSDEMVAMPCCPSEAPKAPVDCGKCLAMAGCSAGFLSGMPGAVAMPLPIPTKGIALASADFARDGLGHPPPEHPPRSLI